VEVKKLKGGELSHKNGGDQNGTQALRGVHQRALTHIQNKMSKGSQTTVKGNKQREHKRAKRRSRGGKKELTVADVRK